ncbi:MAG: YchJ family metal-binding protein [Pseudomonadota bacterium]
MFEPCPCGGASYAACCARLHLGQAEAETAERLMRSRYSAFARGEAAYLLRTWAPETRPSSVGLDPRRVWTGLTVHAATETGPDAATVAFTARYAVDGKKGALSETSRFRREHGRWLYVDGEIA